MAIEEIGSSVISRQPVAVQQKVVNVVGKNELFDGDAAGAQAGGEIDGLREIDVAIVIAMNEKHGRFPGFHGSYRGRFVGEFGELGRNVLAIPVVGGPIVHAVEIDPCCKNIGVAAKAQRGEISAITSAP